MKRVCEFENCVLTLETKYLSKSRGLYITEIVDDVHCLTRFLRRVKEWFCKKTIIMKSPKADASVYKKLAKLAYKKHGGEIQKELVGTGFLLDKQLSDRHHKVFYNPTTKKAVRNRYARLVGNSG